MLRKTRLVPISGVVIAALGTATATGATPSTDLVSGRVAVSLAPYSQAEREDILRVADSEGMSAAAAEAAFGWQDGFAIAATAIEERFPESFAGAQVVQSSPARARLDFKGEVPAEVTEMLASVDPRVKIELAAGAVRTTAERDELVIATHRAVSKNSLVGRYLSPMLNDERGKIETIVTPNQTADGMSATEIVFEISESLPDELRSATAVVVDSAQRITRQAGLPRYGGGYLQNPVGGYCTAGFNVIRPTGTDGIATAAHCHNTMQHRNTPSANPLPLTFHWQHAGEWGDVQWHSSPTEGHPNDFYYAPGARRDALAIANPVDNQRICRFGHTTGAQCNEVDNLSVCYTDGDEYCRLVQMKNHEAGPGDSGGPWYWGNTAYGIHSGDRWYLLFHHDVWSRATYLDEALTVRVRTS